MLQGRNRFETNSVAAATSPSASPIEGGFTSDINSELVDALGEDAQSVNQDAQVWSHRKNGTGIYGMRRVVQRIGEITTPHRGGFRWKKESGANERCDEDWC